ncbi:immunoglobulin superfamily member 1-like isoform X5 [Chelonia mydas]|uniref:immunoglobulin superfamily member 1-like isoform X5 n=1 Tax=Chelonia mydas TaxID=8469 RepID=UPI001CA85F2F|nr:immunoglobulin superfamily member 1-like isoform X5 [Chelonia mydas]
MVLTLLLPLLASLQMLPRPASPADLSPAPKLLQEYWYTVYLSGEQVNLTCSAPEREEVSGYRFFYHKGQQDPSIVLNPNAGARLEFTAEKGNAGLYSCAYWRLESNQEILSRNSSSVSTSVTRVPAPLPAPQLTVSPNQPVYVTGETVTLTCSADWASTVSGIRFFRDGQEIHSKELSPPWYSYTEFIPLSEVSISQAGTYTCESWKTVSGREIPSERSRPISITMTAPLPAPQLTVSPKQPVYVTGETVTLTCSADRASNVSGIRFFRDGLKIHSKDLPPPWYSYTESIPLSEVSRSQARTYTCESWKTVSGREIPSERSRPISITVTDHPPLPSLSMDPPSGVVSEGFPLLVTCMAPRDANQRRFHFYKDSVKLVPGDAGSEISTTEPSTSSMNISVLSILQASPNNIGEFTCEYEENVSGRWIPSHRSHALNVTVTASHYTRDILLRIGGVLLLTGALAALLCYCHRKKRVPKPLKSTKGSEPGEHTRNLDPGRDNEGSKATCAGAEQMEQGSEVTYALMVFPASQAHATQTTKNLKPAEDEHVLYSEIVTTHTWKATK